MRSRVASALLLALSVAAFGGPAPKPAKEGTAARVAPPSRKDLKAARGLAAQALEALRAGDAERAADLWDQAARLAPDAAPLRFNRGVALDRAGKRDEAAAAYETALTGASGEAELRSLFNLATLRLEDAWGARDLLAKDDAELAEAVRKQAQETGTELPDQVQQAVEGLRNQIAEKGVAAAEESVERLRDLVRRDRHDRDAVGNLELAQRTLRVLREELKRQQQEQQRQDEQGDTDDQEKEKDPEQDQQEKNQDTQDDQEDAQKEKPDPESQDDAQQDPKKGEQEEGDQEQPSPQSEADQDPEQQESQAQQDPARQQAEQALQKLLDAAARRAREVREMRRARARRVPVEKDW